MYHYTYLIEFTDGMKYVGAKSRLFHPNLDVCYLGSGKALPINRTPQNCIKTVLAIYTTRKEATDAEIAYIDKHNCCASPEYYNIRRRTYDRHGCTKESCSGAAISSKIQQGRSAKTHKYLKEKGEKFKQYTGNNRTPALLDADKRRGDTIRGTKNPAKGHPGISNNGFTPWYYVTPTGDYHEVYSITRKDFASKIGLTPRQIEHRFHYSNIHKPGKTKPLKGWVFGTLPKP